MGDGLPPNCPPEGHAPPLGTFYRLAEPHHAVGDRTRNGSWRKPYKVGGAHYGRTDICEAHAFSLFDDLEVLRNARRLNPWAAGKAIAEVRLLPHMGSILKTPSTVAEGHHDWWPDPVEFVPHATVVECPQDRAS